MIASKFSQESITVPAYSRCSEEAVQHQLRHVQFNLSSYPVDQ